LCNNEIKVSPRIVNKLRIWKNNYNELNHHCQQVTKHNEPPNPISTQLQQKKKTQKMEVDNPMKTNDKGIKFWSFVFLLQPQALCTYKISDNMMHLMLLSCKSSVTRKKNINGVDQSPGLKHTWCRCTYKYTRI
jgi:hypothetical protein